MSLVGILRRGKAPQGGVVLEDIGNNPFDGCAEDDEEPVRAKIDLGCLRYSK